MLDNLAETPAAETETEVEVKTTPEPSEGTQKDAPATETEKPEGEEPKELTEADKVKLAMQKRINKQTAQNAELRRQLDEASRQRAEPAPKDDGAPKEADFTSYEDYFKAVGKHEAKKEFDAKEAADKKAAHEATRTTELAEQRKAFDVKEAEFRKTTPDYDDVVQVLNEHITTVNQKSAGFQVFRDVMLSAPDLPALSYHLGKNPELIESMLTMKPAQIAWKLIETAVGLEKPKPKEQAKLPTPPKPVNAKGKSEKPVAEKSGKELMAWLKEK